MIEPIARTGSPSQEGPGLGTPSATSSQLKTLKAGSRIHIQATVLNTVGTMNGSSSGGAISSQLNTLGRSSQAPSEAARRAGCAGPTRGSDRTIKPSAPHPPAVAGPSLSPQAGRGASAVFSLAPLAGRGPG